jgi:hypothetical protein
MFTATPYIAVPAHRKMPQPDIGAVSARTANAFATARIRSLRTNPKF